MQEMEDVVKKIIDFMQFGSFAAFGAMAKYMSDISNGRRVFSVLSTLTTIFIAFFMGNVIVSFLGTDFEYLGGTLMVAGWSLDKVISLMEGVTDKWIKKLKAWL